MGVGERVAVAAGREQMYHPSIGRTHPERGRTELERAGFLEVRLGRERGERRGE